MDEPIGGEAAELERDAPYWAQPVTRLKVEDVPDGATNLNLEGRQIVSPLHGFGQLWQKTYRISLKNIQSSPQEVMRVWKEKFAQFQPPGNHFYPPMTGVEPGKILFIDSNLPVVPGSPGIIPVASGVLVLYADESMFTVMTPEGFPESGWNSFSVYEEDGVIYAQVQSLARATDPIYEFGLRFMGGASFQEKTWQHVLRSLAAFYHIESLPEMDKRVIDNRLQWSEAKNIWKNASISTILYKLSLPLRWLFKKSSR